MVVVLLVLIALILLFGAAVVKGWLVDLALKIVGFLLASTTLTVLIVLFGETAVWIGAACLGAGLICLKAAVQDYGAAEKASRRRSADEAWANWHRDHDEPPVLFGSHRPSKLERKQLKKRYLRDKSSSKS